MEFFDDLEITGESYQDKPFKKGAYEYCTFTNCDLSDTDLAEVRFTECEFIDCNLSNAKVLLSSFQDSRMVRCKVLGVRFDTTNGFNFSIHFEDCQLDHSVFTSVDLSRSSFKGCSMVGGDLTEAKMSMIKAVGCNFLNTLFDRTDLTKTDIRGAQNLIIDPTINRIEGARISQDSLIGLLSKYDLNVD